MSKTWQELVADKKQRQADSIPKEWIITPPDESVLDVTSIPEACGLLSPKEIAITGSSVEVLLQKLAAAEWSSVEVTTAFYKRAIIAQQLVNCLTEIFVDRALARAAELDEYLKTNGKVVGPLHGLPISLKDQVSIKGLETTIGYVSWLGQYAEKDAALTEILYECGAVPFVRTNIPQTLMWPETRNNIFGRTTNPFNRSLTCGGSSGGEGALIGLKGSPLGVGSDLGGSVRIPAAYNGLYGFRPSYGRIPYGGSVNSLEGQDSILSVLGPLSCDLYGVKAFTQAVVSKSPWLKDPLAVRKKWDEEAYQLSEHGGGKQLCFGFIFNDGNVVPHPPISRALESTKKALIAAGHKVVEWTPLKHQEICANAAKIWDAGAAEDYRVTTAPTGEPVISTMALTEGDASAAAFRPSEQKTSAYDLWQIQRERRDFRQAYLDHWQKSVEITGTGRPVDALISPVAAYCAPPHGKSTYIDYTLVWNSLDYPALVFPVTKVDPYLDAKKPAHEFLSAADKINYELYDPETFKNAPVALQVIGRTLEEEAVIAMSEIVDAAIRDLPSVEGKI